MIWGECKHSVHNTPLSGTQDHSVTAALGFWETTSFVSLGGPVYPFQCPGLKAIYCWQEPAISSLVYTGSPSTGVRYIWWLEW